MASKIKKNDRVIVITGKDKGRQGVVTKVAVTARGRKRVYVEGVNLLKKHTRPDPSKNQQGGVISKEASIDISNVAIINPATNKADRVGFKVLENGRKVRVYKSNGEEIAV